MRDEPRAMTELRPVTPPALERVVRRCLSKDPDGRFQSASDLAFSLDAGSGNSVDAGQVSNAPGRPGRRRFAWIVGLAMLVAGGFLGSVMGRRVGFTSNLSGREPQVMRRFDLVLPDSLPMAYVGNAILGLEMRSLALSPSADMLAYVALQRGRSLLVTLDLTTGAVNSLSGTQGAFCPFFSPDGDWVGFLTETELKKIAVHGLKPVVLANVDEPWGAQWLDSERIIVAERQSRILTFVRASGGRLDSREVDRFGYSAQLTPDRSGLLFASGRRLARLDLESGTTSFLTARGCEAVGATSSSELLYGLSPLLPSSAQLLYVQSGSGGTLVGVPVVPASLRPLSDPIPVATDVRISDPGEMAQFIASSGVLVYAADPGSGLQHFVRRWADGKVDSLAFPTEDYGMFELAPDGSRIAVLKRPPSGHNELWIFNLARGTQERIREVNVIGSWSADGLGLVCSCSRGLGVPPAMLRLHLDGTGLVDTLTGDATPLFFNYPALISRDGRWTLRGTADGAALAGGNNLLAAGVVIPNAGPLGRFSPDSRWLAVTCSEAGKSEVYVVSVDDPAHRVRVSTAGGEEPRWSADGRQIVFRYGNDWFQSSILPGAPLSAGLPVKLFAGPYVNVGGYSHDLFPDGSHLLLLGSGSDVAQRLRVVTGLEALFAKGK